MKNKTKEILDKVRKAVKKIEPTKRFIALVKDEILENEEKD